MKRISVNSAAKLTGLSRYAIEKAIKDGQLRCLRVGVGFRILPADLEHWMRGRTVGRAA